MASAGFGIVATCRLIWRPSLNGQRRTPRLACPAASHLPIGGIRIASALCGKRISNYLDALIWAGELSRFWAGRACVVYRCAWPAPNAPPCPKERDALVLQKVLPLNLGAFCCRCIGYDGRLGIISGNACLQGIARSAGRAIQHALRLATTFKSHYSFSGHCHLWPVFVRAK